MIVTHIDIETRGKSRILWLTIVLTLYFLCGFVVFWWIGKNIALLLFGGFAFGKFPAGLTLFELGVCLGIAIVTALIHLAIGISQGTPKILESLAALPLDPHDTEHAEFEKTVRSIELACGRASTKTTCVVIPSVILNAFAVSDLKGRAAIGITEGLLARLNRPQREAVIAHEMAHIMNGDSLITTTACSLFAVFGQIRIKIQDWFENSDKGQPPAQIYVFLLFMMALAALIDLGARLLNCVISRQREFVADAIAVKLTLNPLVLAEALLKMSRGRTSLNIIDPNLAPIFIMPFNSSGYSERTGILADLFSSHPPVTIRVDILSQLGRIDPRQLIETLDNHMLHENALKELNPLYQFHGRAVEMSQPQLESARWLAWHEDQWKGPFAWTDMIDLPWLTPEVWCCPEKSEQVLPAGDFFALRPVFEEKQKRKEALPPSEYPCAICRKPLGILTYAGNRVYTCVLGHGVMVEDDDLRRIIMRDAYQVEEAAWEAARRIKNARITPRIIKGEFVPYPCPVCSGKMHRRIYDYQRTVVVDYCHKDRMFWLDEGELPILQLLMSKYDML